MTTKTDPFTATENPLGNVGGKWTTFLGSGLQCVNPGAKGNTAAGYDGSMWRASDYTFANDQDATVTVSAVSNADYFGPCVRCATTGGGQGYFLRYSNGAAQVDIYLFSAGALGSSIKSVSTTLSASDTLTLSVSGTTLTIKQNGSSIGTVTDSTYSTGQPGVGYGFFNSNASLIGSFTATDAGGGVTITPTKGAATFTGKNPTVTTSGFTISPVAGALAFTGKQPTIANSGGSATRTPVTGALAFTGQQPTLTLTVAAPGVGALAITGQSPTIAVSSFVTRQPTAGALSFTGKQPTIAAVFTTTRTPSAGALAFTGKNPSVANSGGSRSISPSSGSLTLSGNPASLINSAASHGGGYRKSRRRGRCLTIYGR